MKTGIFGGTFDPIHTGHLAILKAAAESGLLDRILVIPNAYPPHKSLDQISMATYRYEMTRIALEATIFAVPVILSDIELFRQGKSYTLDTINELKDGVFKEDQLTLIYGSDVVYEIENWHKPQEIMQECDLLFAERPGFDGERMRRKVQELKVRYLARVTFFNAEYIDISSTGLREMLGSDPERAAPYLVPALRKWIDKNEIYKNQQDLSKIPSGLWRTLQEEECELQKTITKDRLVHSINTMRESVKLALLYHGDVEKSAIAGLLHDCAKSSAFKEKRSLMKTGSSKEIKESEEKYSDIFHAYEGRRIAAETFQITDPDILDSIYYHTTSRANSSLLEKIIFVADKIEPGRTFTGIDRIRLIAYHNLEEGLAACLKDIIELLHRTGKTPHPDSIASYEDIKAELKSHY